MYNSQYYTCEQIDQRLLQGYVDDFNSHTSQSLTKAQFLAKLAEVFSPTFLSDYFTKSEINNIFDVILTNGFIYGGVATPNGTPYLGGDSNDDYQSKLFFIATQPGTYTNYGGIVIPNYGFHIILWDTDTWSFDTIFTYANIGYFECDTAGNQADKSITASGYVLAVGGSIKIKMLNANTANNATLNINSTGAKPIIYDGERASASNTWEAGETVEVYYDGTNFYANNVKGGSGNGVFDICIYNNTPYYDSLEDALGGNNISTRIPISKRSPGMSIKFNLRIPIDEEGELTYSYKYVQYRYKLSDTDNAKLKAVENWQEENNEENSFEIIEPIGYYMVLPDNSVGTEGDYIMFSNGTVNHRIYQKINGIWTNVTSRMNPYNYYLWRGLFYYKEDLTNDGKFLPINDCNINRVNLAGNLLDFPSSNITLTKQDDSINTSYLNTVYKVDVNANVAGALTKSVSISAAKGVSVGFLIKYLNNESDLDVVSVRYNAGATIYYKEKRQNLGNGWYFFNYYQWNTEITSISLIFDRRGLSACSFLVSDVQICEGLYPLQPNYLSADNNIQKQIDVLKNNSWNIIPILSIGPIPSSSEGNNGDYSILRNGESDNRLYQKINGAWVNVLASAVPTNLYSLYGVLYYFTNLTGSPLRGTLKTFMNDNINRVNLAGDIENLTKSNLTLTKQEESIGPNYNNTVYKVDAVAGVYNNLRKTGLSLNAGCTCAVLCKPSNIEDLQYVKFLQAGVGTTIPYKTQYIGNGWYFLYAQYNKPVTLIDFGFDLRTVQNSKTYYVSDLQICEGLLPLFPNYSLKYVNSGALKNDWVSKKLSTFGDSVTAHCNGDFTNPFDITTTNWANKVASYYNISKAYHRGIGGQRFIWGTGGGSIAWCTSDGNYVNRKDGTTYDDYLNPATQATVLADIEGLANKPYNPSIHTLVRGTLSSWLRITTMYPASIKDTIDVVLVMAHNDASYGATKLNAELSWVSESAIDIEWAASTQYQTYGGDYNIQDSLKGAIASTIMKLQAWMPQAVIVLMTPISGKGTTGELNPALTDENMQTVAEKVREVHKLMSIPLIDMYATDGINGLNRTTFISDNIHPFTQAGSKALARAIVGGMKIIEPRDLFD